MTKNIGILGLGLALLFLLLFMVLLALPSQDAPFGYLFSQFLNAEGEGKVIRLIRFPEAVTAGLGGLSLALAGLQMQTLFNNPIAGPGILGISSGAALGVALFTLAGIGLGLGSWSFVLIASLGAIGVLVLLMLLSLRLEDMNTLLVIGVLLAGFFGSIVMILEFFASKDALSNYVFWLFGSFSSTTNSQLVVLTLFTVFGLLLNFLLIPSTNRLMMGEEYAKTIGLNVRQCRLLLVFNTGLFCGLVTAFCGPIAFIGIATPHIARILAKRSDHRVLVPITALLGINIGLLCLLLSKSQLWGFSLPINAVTSLLGVPFVVWLLISGRNIRSSF